MNKKEELLIDYLLNHSDHPISSRELSSHFGVSTRQIRNYIRNINEEDPEGRFIEAGNDGYFIVPEKKDDIRQHDIQFNPGRRQDLILQNLVVHPVHGRSMKQLVDLLYVSESTIINDVKAINRTLQYGLRIKNRDNVFLLDGEENAKRKLITDILTRNSAQRNFSDDVRQTIDFYDSKDLRSGVLDIIISYNIHINDYCFNNIMLHLIVMIERIEEGFIMPSNVDLSRFKETTLLNVAKDITMFVSDLYNIEINDGELMNLLIILESNTTQIDYTIIDYDDLSSFIDEETIRITRSVIEKTRKVYDLGDFDDRFMCLFTIHVQNVLLRCRNNYKIKNPLANRIRIESPLIYDIATTFAHYLYKEAGVTLNDDEIAYLSFHIGGYLENLTENKDKIDAIFVYANYYNNYESVYNRLIRAFENEIVFTRAVSILDFDKLDLRTDLFITTSEIDRENSILISPFLSNTDINAIRERVISMKKHRDYSDFSEVIRRFLKKELFFVHQDFADKYEALRFIAGEVIAQGYAEKGYQEAVLKREELSSTSYQLVSIPHSLGDEVLQSFIAVAIPERPLDWDGNKVKLIIMLGASGKDAKEYKNLFNNLVPLLLDDSFVNSLIRYDSYDEFIEFSTRHINEAFI